MGWLFQFGKWLPDFVIRSFISKSLTMMLRESRMVTEAETFIIMEISDSSEQWLHHVVDLLSLVQLSIFLIMVSQPWHYGHFELSKLFTPYMEICDVHHRIICPISGLYPADASNTLFLIMTANNVSRHCQRFLKWKILSLGEKC